MKEEISEQARKGETLGNLEIREFNVVECMRVISAWIITCVYVCACVCTYYFPF